MKKYFLTSLVVIGLVFNSLNTMAGVKGVVMNFVAGDSVSLVNPFIRTGGLLEKSAIGKKGEFEFKYSPTEIGYYFISFSNGKNALIVLSPGNNGTIDVDFPAGKLVKAAGSKENEFLKKISDIYYSYEQQKGEPYADIAKLEQNKAAEIQNLLKNTPVNFAMAFITDYYGLSKDDFLPINDEILSSLIKTYPSSEVVKNRKSEIDKDKRLAIGFLAPEITLPTPDGKMFSLSSLKGKVVLIDFWAAWCGPCRRENPQVVRMYNTYKEHGFDILGVSLDRDRDAWLKAIESDGLIWNHVSDLKHWQSAAGQLYGVGSIPFTVLVDREGKIVAKGLRGEELERKIKELLLQ